MCACVTSEYMNMHKHIRPRLAKEEGVGASGTPFYACMCAWHTCMNMHADMHAYTYNCCCTVIYYVVLSFRIVLSHIAVDDVACSLLALTLYEPSS